MEKQTIPVAYKASLFLHYYTLMFNSVELPL